MRIGISQLDITPEAGVELSGFAARTQPSLGVLDPLYARCLYLEDNGERLLWIHADLIGLEREFVLDFRAWAAEHLAIEPGRVMISAIHTHSGPATMHIQEAGAYDATYVRSLRGRLEQAARAAVVSPEECEVVLAEGSCDLAVDRRNRASAHTDPLVGAIGWRRPNGAFAGVLVNYPMHAVALGPTNRKMSADVPGQAAVMLSRELPGHPLVLVTNGACGNLNPPAENVPFEQVQAWGGQIARAVLEPLRRAAPSRGARLRVASRVVPLPADALTVKQIDAFAREALRDQIALGEWGERFRRAVQNWQTNMTRLVQSGRAPATFDAELLGVRIGPVTLIGVNAEVFSRFTEQVRRGSGQQSVYTVGYANGVIGYLPTAAAYEEGGYEVESAHIFYMTFRIKPGGLELLAEQASELVRELA